ncbi:MAG: HAMP domain-containing histidine kinase [Candidatus Hydrogenedentes bacterium]|nr:HAMP domain-containing histidine kinase [Candidatus Hydrogenedentota bacterium]
MKPKLLAVFLLIVFAPLAILGWLGLRFARTEGELMRHRVQEVMAVLLRDFDADIAGLLEQRERELMALPLIAGRPPNEVRALIRTLPAVNQLFALDERGVLMYPDATKELSSTEEAFLRRTSDIWRRHDILAAAGDAGSDRTAPVRKSDQPPERSSQKGWHSWYWGEGVNLIFWWREASGTIVGAELNRSRLMADIIAVLPETGNVPMSQEGVVGMNRLVNSKREPVYQWGHYLLPDGELPLVTIDLSPPLSAWQLESYLHSPLVDADFGRGLMFNVFGGLAFLAAALVGLAVYFYREQTRDLREAQQRVNFVNQVSHELKTPLTNIRMYAELLEGHLEEAAEKPKTYVGVIVAESQRLSRLIGNVLSFSRSQRNALTVHGTRGSVDDALRCTIQSFEPSLAKRGIETRFNANATDTIEFDRDVLEQIAGNLLSNVEKYAQGADRVDITSVLEGESVTITVADNGPGIPARERDRIFQPFHRVSNKLTDGVAGAGIGLSIARDLARLHGGDLVLDPSEKGARFKVVLHVLPTRTQEPS